MIRVNDAPEFQVQNESDDSDDSDMQGVGLNLARSNLKTRKNKRNQF